MCCVLGGLLVMRECAAGDATGLKGVLTDESGEKKNKQKFSKLKSFNRIQYSKLLGRSPGSTRTVT